MFRRLAWQEAGASGPRGSALAIQPPGISSAGEKSTQPFPIRLTADTWSVGWPARSSRSREWRIPAKWLTRHCPVRPKCSVGSDGAAGAVDNQIGGIQSSDRMSDLAV
jgi:hypothetical protein